MAAPIAPFKPANIVSAMVSGADFASLGVVQTYTVPAGRASKLLFASAVLTSGVAPQLSLVWTRGAVNIRLVTFTALVGTLFDQWMVAGDLVTWTVDIVGALGVGQTVLSIEEYEVK